MGKSFLYFVTRSSNVPYVLTEALQYSAQHHEVKIFFDLDGAHVLDKRYLKKMERAHSIDLTELFQEVVKKGIKLYGCQMNVLIAQGLELIEGVELAGVATFLEIAYEADAVMSY